MAPTASQAQEAGPPKTATEPAAAGNGATRAREATSPASVVPFAAQNVPSTSTPAASSSSSAIESDGDVISPARPAVVTLTFLGLSGDAKDAATIFLSEERVRVALQHPPFKIEATTPIEIPSACLADAVCRKEKFSTLTSVGVVYGHVAQDGTQLTLDLRLSQTMDAQQLASASIVETNNADGRSRLLQSIDPLVRALLQTLDPGRGPPVPADLVLEGLALDDLPPEDLQATSNEVQALNGEPTPSAEDEEEDKEWVEEEEVEDQKRVAVADEDEDSLWSEHEPAADKTPARRLGDDATPVAIEKKPSVKAGDGVNYAAWAWSGGFLGAGAVMALGGIGFDLLSPTSVDAELNFLDGIGPGMVVLGAGVALVGLVVNPFLWIELSEEGGESDASS